MSDEQRRFLEWLDTLRARVSETALEEAGEGEEVAVVGFREEAFTEVLLSTLVDLGQVQESQPCYFERRIGRGIARVNAWSLDEEGRQVELVTTCYRGLGEPESVSRTELQQLVSRAVRVIRAARRGYHLQMEPASEAFDMMQRLHEMGQAVERVQVVVLVDGRTGDSKDVAFEVDGLEVRVDVWDLQRLFRAEASGLPYEPVELDLVERLGTPLPCLAMPVGTADYKSYLLILPGELLYSLYDEFGSRLLELNVRSFLQARGKVNRGIRDTLKENPDRFMAYNNGISATAEDVVLTGDGQGSLAITSIRGLQIVNGGQTVASIHRARSRDRLDLSEVHVQAKLTLVSPEQIETLVPLISRYANTQNRVNEADFSSNHPYHVKIQQLSQSIWAPGEQSRWFYERARGQYQVAKAREGVTSARVRRFNTANPSSQRFDKVKLAKYENTWAQFPHVVSFGGQKNFVHFMQRLKRSHPADWVPDAEYYRQLIAKAIIFKQAEKIARQHQFPAYRANAVAYTVGLVSYRTAGRVDLMRIWNHQSVSPALRDTMYDWMPDILDEIVASSEGRNVTEWCKKEDCWRHIQLLDVEVSDVLEAELNEGQPLPTVGAASGQQGVGLTAEDRENIARVMQISPEEWVHLSGWGTRTGKLKDWQSGIAATLASYAAADWNRVPSIKQARHGVQILRIGDDEGGRMEVEDL